jgi:hypothetical protein
MRKITERPNSLLFESVNCGPSNLESTNHVQGLVCEALNEKIAENSDSFHLESVNHGPSNGVSSDHVQGLVHETLNETITKSLDSLPFPIRTKLRLFKARASLVDAALSKVEH